MNSGLVVIGLVVVCVVMMGCSGKRPDGAGMYDGGFHVCPSSPNCVSSEAADNHFIEPFKLKAPADKVWSELQEVIKAYEGEKATIISATEIHVYAEFKTLLMRYVDDVEFHLHTDKKIIAIRSASRLGYSDLGANRKRIENIRKHLQDKGLVN